MWILDNSLYVCVLSIAGVYLSHKGEFYANNSLIIINEIGTTLSSSSLNNGLQCITDKKPCCQSYRAGEWFLPDGSVVPLLASSRSFYRNRNDYGSVNLNRFNSEVTYPTGLFCCVVLDATDALQTLCINICKHAVWNSWLECRIIATWFDSIP